MVLCLIVLLTGYWIAVSGCPVLQSQPGGSVPWAVSRAAAPHPSWGCRHPHPRAPWVLSPGLISINYDSQTRKKPCKLNPQSSQTAHSASVQVQATSVSTCGLLYTKAKCANSTEVSKALLLQQIYARTCQDFAHPLASPVPSVPEVTCLPPEPSPSLLTRWGISYSQIPSSNLH